MDRVVILNIIREKIGEMNGAPITIDENSYIDFRGAGLNSIGLMTLIVYLEEYFNFEGNDEAFNLAQFSFIKNIIDYVIQFTERPNGE